MRKINWINVLVLTVVGVACFVFGGYTIKRVYDPILEKSAMYTVVYRDMATLLYQLSFDESSWDEAQRKIDNAAYQSYNMLRREIERRKKLGERHSR